MYESWSERLFTREVSRVQNVLAKAYSAAKSLGEVIRTGWNSSYRKMKMKDLRATYKEVHAEVESRINALENAGVAEASVALTTLMGQQQQNIKTKAGMLSALRAEVNFLATKSSTVEGASAHEQQWNKLVNKVVANAKQYAQTKRGGIEWDYDTEQDFVIKLGKLKKEFDIEGWTEEEYEKLKEAVSILYRRTGGDYDAIASAFSKAKGRGGHANWYCAITGKKSDLSAAAKGIKAATPEYDDVF